MNNDTKLLLGMRQAEPVNPLLTSYTDMEVENDTEDPVDGYKTLLYYREGIVTVTDGVEDEFHVVNKTGGDRFK